MSIVASSISSRTSGDLGSYLGRDSPNGLGGLPLSPGSGYTIESPQMPLPPDAPLTQLSPAAQAQKGGFQFTPLRP